VGNIVAVCFIPFVGDLSDKVGRKPMIIIGALGSGLLAFPYLWAISIRSVPLAFGISLLMWGCVYQGWNAVYPSSYPELFPARSRVSAMAIAQNLGIFLTAMLPAIFAFVAPPHSANIPYKVASVTLALCVLAAIAAWTTKENYRTRTEDLGNPNAVPVSKEEYFQLRAKSIAG
jgi:MFS family permease